MVVLKINPGEHSVYFCKGCPAVNVNAFREKKVDITH